MLRKFSAFILLAPLVASSAVLLVACGGGGSNQEKQVLTNFFRASRVRDNATLANISAVSFDSRTEGTVQDFEITNVSEEQRRSLQIRQLTEEEEKAKQADAEFARKKKEYQDANLEAIERIVKAERSGQTNFRGKDAEVHAAWSKWRNEQSTYQKRLSEARAKLANERALAVNSLTPPGRQDVDVSGMEVELITKQLTVNAEVKDPSGATTPKTYIVTLQRAVGKGADGNTTEGRWIITSIRPQGGGTPTTN